jgi:hypothetical protein
MFCLRLFLSLQKSAHLLQQNGLRTLIVHGMEEDINTGQIVSPAI